jgi:O-antigen biosynthesis protein
VLTKARRSTQAGHGVAGVGELQVPAAIRVLDVEQPIESLSLSLPDGRPYRTVMLLVRRSRRPLAIRVLSLDESGRISASEISAAIASVVDADPIDASEEHLQPTGNRLEPGGAPPISVVIATCGNDSMLVRCVHSVLACDYENVEVIVVDNRPEVAATSVLLAEHFAHDARVRYVQETRAGLSYARNKGLALAESELVAFTDDDIVVDGGWLRAIASAFTSEVSCVTGLIMPLVIDTPTQALFEQFAGFGKGFERRSFQMADNHDDPLFPYAAGSFGSGANTALRRSVALRLGGFDVKLGTGTAACGGEDLDMYIKLLLADEKIVYSPAAVLFHEHPPSGGDLRRRVFSYGVGLTAMLTKQIFTGPRLPLARAAPAGVRYMLDAGSRKYASRGAGYPRTLTVLERLGMLAGPLAYALSARRCRAARQSPTAHDAQFVPSAVSVIELDHALVDVELGHNADGRAYGSLVALVRLHGDPLATIEVPAKQGRITTRALMDAVWAAARGGLEQHARTHECVDPAALTADALANGLPPVGRCPSRRVDEVEPPFVSLIVPTARRPERIQTCLESLRRLRYPYFEIIVVDNAPGDSRTRAVAEACAREDERVRYVAESLPGSSVARNRGVCEARGDILAFTDDDAVVDAEWLRWIVEPFLRDARVGVVTGLVLPARLDTPDQRWFEEFSGFGKGFEPRVFDRDEHRADERLFYPYWGGVFGSGNNMAFRPSVLKEIGGFDPALGAGSRALAGEDVECFSHAIIAGSRLAYEPRAVCWHDHRADAAAVDRQMFSYGVGLTAILTKWLLRDPRLARVMVTQSARFLTSLIGVRRASSAAPHELSRLGTQLRMNRRRNTLGLQVRGYCLGPALYLRSVIWAKRLRLRAVLTGARGAHE